jgi:hypothetical protein
MQRRKLIGLSGGAGGLAGLWRDRSPNGRPDIGVLPAFNELTVCCRSRRSGVVLGVKST